MATKVKLVDVVCGCFGVNHGRGVGRERQTTSNIVGGEAESSRLS